MSILPHENKFSYNFSVFASALQESINIYMGSSSHYALRQDILE